MTAAWVTLAGLTVGSALIRAAGPVLVGGREVPPVALRMIELMAPALLAALVVVGTFTDADGNLVLDARAAGLAAAGGVLLWRRDQLLTAVATAAVVAALVRAIG